MLPFQLATTPGFQVTYILKGNLVYVQIIGAESVLRNDAVLFVRQT